ncbi:MAG: ATP-binding protein [Marinifilaceae bacterium]|jgi:MinD superfamily P-loop ATPase|nr:ATP-binding protein [Marinifilaceae bacterium]
MILAIASGKGGTGKTTLSTNLASYISEKQKVTLADLDVEEPNSGLFLDVEKDLEKDMFKKIPEWKESECILCGKCQEWCKFNCIQVLGDEVMIFPEFCHTCHMCVDLCPGSALSFKDVRMGRLSKSHKGNLTFVESRLNIGEEQAVSLISQTIDYTENYADEDELIIIDAPPGAACPVMEVVDKSDFVILVTEPTPFGLSDLKIAVETMRVLNREFAVVINRYGIGNDDVITYCKAENIDILAKINNDRKLAELYSKGNLLYKHSENLREQLDLIIEKLHLLK